MPYVFTESGVAMLSSVLNSDFAIEVNIQIMRAFVQIRGLTINYKDLRDKVNELEIKSDESYKVLIEAISELNRKINPSLKKNRRKIGL